jgi:CHASE2 domain-containing sensor protein
MKAFREFLLRQGQRFGRAAWMFYALVFLLAATLLLGLVYLLFGWLIYVSPNAVLVLTGILVVLILYTQRRRGR